jgi:GNAT superfamily N-acetyltransferase
MTHQVTSLYMAPRAYCSGASAANAERNHGGTTGGRLGGMLLRPARVGDELAVAGVHVRAWQVGYRGLLPDAVLDGLRIEERAGRYTFGSADPDRPRTIVAEDGGEILGFAATATATANTTDAPGVGELAALYVEPGAWGRGVGRVLIAAARARFVERGFGEAVLWLMVGNERAARFYAADGWREEAGSRCKGQTWGAELEKVRYRRALR